MSLSNCDISASRALFAAALNLLTFSCGVSPGGPGFRGGCVFEDFELAGTAGFEACGVVDVKRVASVADRGIVRVGKSLALVVGGQLVEGLFTLVEVQESADVLFGV